MRKKKTPLGSRIASHLEYPENMLGIYNDITITDDRLIEISNCRAIIKYADDEIIIRTRDKILCASGDSLTLDTYNGRRLEIRGIIHHIEFKSCGAAADPDDNTKL